MSNAILLISCPDQKGITASVTDFVFRHNGNIEHADQHIDKETNTFFMRIEWALAEFKVQKAKINPFDAPQIKTQGLLRVDTEQRPLNPIKDIIAGTAECIKNEFQPIADKFKMHWSLYFTDEVPRVAIFTSKYPHCLYDLLLRQRSGQLACTIPLIISNHADAKPIARNFGVDFFEFPMLKENKREQEERQLKLLKEGEINVVVLARYGQILTKDFVNHFPNQIINIHHSFLPAFAGSNPYAQAYRKGVKIIGATSHYVVSELDAGPIIEQDTVRVSHRDSVADLMRKGEDLERVVLSRAVRWHLERKILVYNNKTVIFD